MLRRCPYILLFGIALFNAFIVDAQSAMPDNVCIGDSRHYSVNSDPGSIYTWWIDGVIQSGFTSNSFIHIWHAQGIYLMEVQEKSANGCPGPVRSGQIIVNPLPSLEASETNVDACCGKGTIDFTFTNVPDGTYSISYDSGAFNNVTVAAGTASVTAPEGIYNNLSITIAGCTSIESANIIIKALNQFKLKIPEAFSPNGDLINDVWTIGNIDDYPKVVITIYNRWGQSLWKSEQGYPHPWDGKSKGVSLPIDSYHYIIDLHNGTKPIVGAITIVK
jgi:gliding motility-associated-like protein